MHVIISGKPGCGKTALAIALHHFLNSLGISVVVNDDKDFNEKIISEFPYKKALESRAGQEAVIITTSVNATKG
jgi:DNA replication protein DnaC